VESRGWPSRRIGGLGLTVVVGRPKGVRAQGRRVRWVAGARISRPVPTRAVRRKTAYGTGKSGGRRRNGRGLKKKQPCRSRAAFGGKYPSGAKSGIPWRPEGAFLHDPIPLEDAADSRGFGSMWKARRSYFKWFMLLRMNVPMVMAEAGGSMWLLPWFQNMRAMSSCNKVARIPTMPAMAMEPKCR
jgi:hypothetical protein